MNQRSPWSALFTSGTAIKGLDFKNLSDWDFYQGQNSQCRPAKVETCTPGTVLNSGVVEATVMQAHLQIGTSLTSMLALE